MEFFLIKIKSYLFYFIFSDFKKFKFLKNNSIIRKRNKRNNKMSGQSIVDRLNAAKHTVAGSALGRAVVKATTEEVMGPKRKHLDCKLIIIDNWRMISFFF